MKITRALLLSSKKQAESWERPQVGQNIFGMALYETKYRYLVDDPGTGSAFRFRIFCVSQETYTDARAQERTRNKVAEMPHVDLTFRDAGELINFLRRYQIDFEEAWQPVEGDEPC